MCEEWSKGGLDVSDSQDENKGGCWRCTRFTHQAFPLVSVMVWGSIPQCNISFVLSSTWCHAAGSSTGAVMLTSGKTWFLVTHSLTFNLIPSDFSDENGP